MTITEIFDRAKKQFDGGNLNEGYTINGKTFHVYYTNQEWEEYKEKMPQKVKDRFDEGKGSEMKPYTRNGYTFPPKMASYASSSRFMVSQGQTFDDFEYEKQLPTGLGGYPAHLDGYLKSKRVFVEAKCHEFYNYSRPELKEGHKKLLDGIIPLLGGKLTYSAPQGKLYLSWKGEDSGFFDFKQMLCHLSGIANMVLEEEEKKVNFIYLIYRSSEKLLSFVEKNTNRQRIQELFNEEKKMAETIDFKSIYGAILHYFNSEKYGYSEAEIREIAAKFSFTFCTQDNFKSVVDNIK